MSKIKLIVEIEKRTYELIKDKPDNIAESIIANGTPYKPTGEFNIDELCRLRSDLRTGMVVGPSLKYQDRIDRYIKALDDVIGAAMRKGGAE